MHFNNNLSKSFDELKKLNVVDLYLIIFEQKVLKLKPPKKFSVMKASA